MRGNHVITLCFLCVVAALGGCSMSGSKYDTGAVDHRYVGRDGTVGPKYFSDDDVRFPRPDDILRKGDSVAIRLLSVYVCDFSEANGLPEGVVLYLGDLFTARDQPPPVSCSQVGLTSSKHYTRGEIAILADVYEQGGGRSIEFRKNAFEAANARVVFYDDDVRESGQYFSFANVPIYGPISYGGGPLFLRLFMLELDDEEAKQTSAMLSKLADLGGKAYPPASPVLKTLASVGSALLSGEQDDIEFRYTMTFDSPGGIAARRMPLAVGSYLLVKNNDRSADFEWDDVSFDNESGALVDKTKRGDDIRKRSNRLRRVTYMTVNVTRNETALEQDGAQLYSAFEQTAPRQSADLAKLEGAVDVLGKQYELAADLDAARQAIAVISRYVTQADANTPLTEVQYGQAVESLTTLVCNSGAVEDDAAKSNQLSAADADYLLASLPTACLATPAEGLSSHWKAACAAKKKVCSYPTQMNHARGEVATITRFVAQGGAKGAITFAQYLASVERLTGFICQSGAVVTDVNTVRNELSAAHAEELLASLPAACLPSPSHRLPAHWVSACGSRQVCSYPPPSSP